MFLLLNHLKRSDSSSADEAWGEQEEDEVEMKEATAVVEEADEEE